VSHTANRTIFGEPCETCDQCGCAIDFPYEWCVCGLPEKQRIQLERVSLQWFIRERELNLLRSVHHD
jgi:hypothetical protein